MTNNLLTNLRLSANKHYSKFFRNHIKAYKPITYILLVSLITLIITANVAKAAVSISISSSPTSVQKYEKFEVSFTLGNVDYSTYNVFNPNLSGSSSSTDSAYLKRGIKVDGYFRKLGAATWLIHPAFYDGNNVWKLRFAAKETGNWEYKIRAEISGSSSETSLRSFAVSDSSNRGFLKVNTTDPRFFEFDNGDPFYPIGFSNAGTVGPDDLNALDYMKDNGANFARIFRGSWLLETMDYHCSNVNNYNLDDGNNFDHMFDRGHQDGIYFELLLDDWTKIKSRSLTGQNDYEACGIYNGDAYGGDDNAVFGFFAESDAKEIYKRKLRYVVARWGYETSLMGIELINELDGGGDANDTWHIEMADYIHSFSYLRHMVSSSTGSGVLKVSKGVPWNSSSIDFVNYHDYGKYTLPWTGGDFEGGRKLEELGSPVEYPWADAATWADRFGRLYASINWRKPLVWTEYGLIDRRNGWDDWYSAYVSDKNARHYKDAIWAAAMNGYGMTHWKPEYIAGGLKDGYSYDPPKYNIFKPLANYINGVNFSGLSHETTYPSGTQSVSTNIISSNVDVFAVALRNSTKAYLYVKNATNNWSWLMSTYDKTDDSGTVITPSPSLKTSTITLSSLTGVSSGSHKLETWSTTQNTSPTITSCVTGGSICESTTDGKIKIKINNLDVDIAYKILPTGGTTEPNITLTKSSSATSASVGQEITYTLTATNIGNAAGTISNVSDPLSEYLQYVAGSASNGGTFNSTTNTVTWTNLGSLAAGASLVRTFRAKVIAVPPPTEIILNGNEAVSFEAEDNKGSLTSPAVTGSDANASGGIYIHVPDAGGADNSKGFVSYPVNASNAPGQYTLWARVYWPTDNSNNSLRVKVDGTMISQIGPGYTYNSWHWVKMGNATNPYTVNLTAIHNLDIIVEDDGARFDKILLTTDASYIPT